MPHKIRKGYVALPKTRREILNRKYPFRLLKEGDYLDPPWPIEELHRVRSAVRHWNRTRDARLFVNVHPDGFGTHGPCVQVGWPKGAVKAPAKKRPAKRS
jgi:hypothetical protein